MASQEEVRRIALSLPGVREGEGRIAFSIEHKGKPKGFVWSWAQRVHPQKGVKIATLRKLIIEAWRCQARSPCCATNRLIGPSAGRAADGFGAQPVEYALVPARVTAPAMGARFGTPSSNSVS